ncbi:unnamed protein product, partial [Leptidea sinapis]
VIIISLTAAAVALAAKLDQVRRPQDAIDSSGANVGLQTPFGSESFEKYPSQNSATENYKSEKYAEKQAEFLRFENEINELGYHYAYETSDGTKAEQDGQVIPGAVPEEGSLKVSGSYSYIADDGQTYSVSYIADENGFRPIGDHLPTPPPIPEAILKSLELTSREDKYNSGRSSYDADAGY